MRRIVLAIIFSLMFTVVLYADTLLLKNGNSIKGNVFQDNENSVKIEEVFGSGTIVSEYSRDEIEQVIIDKEELKVSPETGSKQSPKENSEPFTGTTEGKVKYSITGSLEDSYVLKQKAFEISEAFANTVNVEQVKGVTTSAGSTGMGSVDVKKEACEELISDPLYRRKHLVEWYNNFYWSKDKMGKRYDEYYGILIFCDATKIAEVRGGFVDPIINWKL